MKFLDKISLSVKLNFIISIIVFATAFGSYYSYKDIDSLRKDIDKLYFGSLVQLVNLRNIDDYYQGRLIKSFYKFSNGLMNHQEAKQEFLIAKGNIVKFWKDYKINLISHKNDFIVKELDLKINLLARYINSFSYLDSNKEKSITYSDFKEFIKVTDEITSILKLLNKYEIENVKNVMNNAKNEYKFISLRIIISSIFVIIFILFILTLISKNIYKNQKLLESNKDYFKKISIKDGLTNLYNRRYFEIVAMQEIKKSFRGKNYITFMLLDIDYFKQYNDTYGHGEGDNALITVANELKKTLKRSTDHVFRIGGEEFAILVLDLDQEKSLALGQAIVRTIRKLNIEHKSSKVDEFLTVSVGIHTQIPDDYKDYDSLLKLADKALYKAKNDGRNRAMFI